MDISRTLETFPKSTCHSAVNCSSADMEHSLALIFRPLQTLLSRNCSKDVFAMLVYSSLGFLKENIRY